jgi:mono/diheme cytochrome c family protein
MSADAVRAWARARVCASRQSEPPAHARTRARAPCRLAAVAIAALVLAACDAVPGKPTEAERPLRPAQVTDFDALYAANCAGCHGADGTRGAARPMNDPVYLALAGVERLRRITAEGVAGTPMPGFAASAGGMLTDQQVEILASGMVSRWGKPGIERIGLPPYAATAPGDAARGALAYGVYCAGCHGPDGRGGAKGGAVVDGAYLGLVSDQALRTAVICGRTDLGMPDWRGNVAGRAMSAQEIDDVVAWLVAQRPAFP